MDTCVRCQAAIEFQTRMVGSEGSEDTDRVFVCYRAARFCPLVCLEMARYKGYEWDSYIPCVLIREKKLDILEWAITNGCPMDSETCEEAAAAGDLKLLKFVKERGCDWSDTTCSAAAASGHLHCLKWARENGCPWSADTCWNAAENGHDDCLRWAMIRGCPCESSKVREDFSYSMIERADTSCRRTKFYLDCHAKKIQRAWSDCYWNPKRTICQTRVEREFKFLMMNLSQLSKQNPF